MSSFVGETSKSITSRLYNPEKIFCLRCLTPNIQELSIKPKEPDQETHSGCLSNGRKYYITANNNHHGIFSTSQPRDNLRNVYHHGSSTIHRNTVFVLYRFVVYLPLHSLRPKQRIERLTVEFIEKVKLEMWLLQKVLQVNEEKNFSS